MQIISEAENAQKSIIQKGNIITLNYPCNSKDECYPYRVIFPRGQYQIELFGGGLEESDSSTGIEYYCLGYGAYTKGMIKFTKRTELFFYIGARAGKFNAIHPNTVISRGIPSCGATDLRTKDGNYASFESLKSRIMVAAGAGSCDSTRGQYGHGGTLKGTTATMTYNDYYASEIIEWGKLFFGYATETYNLYM